ncbi:Translocation protein S66 [Malassezia vespertilionis]|uniref:Sec66p n=1 Tax=Malassezia vespertilionis TaxID=2020962 RepID=A0A2N1JCE2_9BASI|nr:Translocation protein S66 [Malassezia vespertilionis]PKI84207.1 Sec66p [Malassezia vespertilionis]WFD06920.1 Translocation protein S66 [Malassezia vespertilionis]
MALSIFVPIAYIASLFAALALFSKVYRSRTQRLWRQYQESTAADKSMVPARAIYNALAEVQDEYPDEDPTSPAWVVPRATLQGALLARAVTALRNMAELRENKSALTSLLEKGSVGDDAAALLETMDQDLRVEVTHIVREAGRFDESWSKLIFESANQVSTNMRYRDIVLDINKQRDEETAKTHQLGLEVHRMEK